MFDSRVIYKPTGMDKTSRDASRRADRPLLDRRIAVTRPVGQADGLLEALRRLGAEPLCHPTIRIVPATDPEPLRRAIGRLEAYDWVVFTSANGVARFWQELVAVRQETRIPSGQRLAAIGPATAAALKERGVRPDLVPSEYVAEAVAAALIAAGPLEGRRLLLPRAAGARQVLPAELRAAGATVDEVVAYETVGDAEGIAALQTALLAGGVDMVTFTAASTVRHFVKVAGPHMGQAGVAVIGPITAEAAREVGVQVDVEAREYTEEGLLQVICEYFRQDSQ